MATAIQIPIKLDAFVFNKSVFEGQSKVPPVTQPEYSSLSGRTQIAEDVLEYLDLAAAAPAAINSRITDVTNDTLRRQRYGIYLSWCLPSVLRKGFVDSGPERAIDRRHQGIAFRAESSNTPQFRAVPNRWFVVRQVSQLKDARNASDDHRVQTFVVESDRIRNIQEFNSDDDVETLATPVGPKDSPLKDQGQSFLGFTTRCTPGYWQNCQNKFARYEDETRQTPLTVVSTANPLFADFQPHHPGVFSLHDDLSDLAGQPAKVSYFVFGYYHHGRVRTEDPFALHFRGPGGGRLPDLFNIELFRTSSKEQDLHGAQLSLNSLDVVQSEPITVCHGSLYDVQWDENSPPEPTWPAEDAAKQMASIAPIAVGTTSVDAIIAYAQACSSADLPEDERVVVPVLLRRLQGLMVQSGDDVDSHLQAADLVSSGNFVRSSMGTVWHMKSRPQSTDQAERPGSAKPATDSNSVRQLRWVNDYQAYLDHSARESRHLQHLLFCEWWRVLADRFSNSAAKPMIRDRVKKLSNRLQQLLGTDTPMSPADLKQQLAEVSKDIQSEATVGQPFYLQQDPVVGCAGLATGWPEQRGGRQPVRLSRVEAQWSTRGPWATQSQWAFDIHDAEYVVKLVETLEDYSPQLDDLWRKVNPSDSATLHLSDTASTLRKSMTKEFFNGIVDRDVLNPMFSSAHSFGTLESSAKLCTDLAIGLLMLWQRSRSDDLSALAEKGLALIYGIRCRMQLAGMDISAWDPSSLSPLQQTAFGGWDESKEFGEKNIYAVPFADLASKLSSLFSKDQERIKPNHVAMLGADLLDMAKGISEGVDPNDISKRLMTLAEGRGNNYSLQTVARLTHLASEDKPPGWGVPMPYMGPPEYAPPDRMTHYEPQAIPNGESQKSTAFRELYTEWIFLHSCRTFGRDASPYHRKHDRWAGQGWFPIMVEWEVKYFHIPFKLWEFGPTGPDKRIKWHIKDGVDLSKQAAIQDDTAIYGGRNIILPSVASQLESMIVRLFETAVTPTVGTLPVISDQEKETLLQELSRLPFMSAQLDGITAQMTTRMAGMHAKPQTDLEGHPQSSTIIATKDTEEYGFDAATISLLGSEASLTPSDARRLSGRQDISKFKPVAHGQFHFTKLNIVDKFGQVVCALDPAHRSREDKRDALYPCTGEYLSCSALSVSADNKIRANTVEVEEPGLCSFIQLPPKINQEARWNAHHMIFDVSLKRWRSAGELENPMWGIVVINYIDRSLQLFTGDGDFLVEYAVGGLAGGRGARTRPWLPEPAQSPPLAAFMERLKNNAYLQAVYSVIEQAVGSLPHTPKTYASAYPAILGKPIALVTMGWSLELAHPPLFSQDLNDPNPVLPLSDYTFPLKMGDEDATYDGLVGYFDASTKETSGFNFDLLRTSFTMESSSAANAFLASNEHAKHKPFWIDMTPENKLDFAALHDAKLQCYAALVDPFTAVHGYSGILPIRQLKIPRWAADQALNRMVGFFKLGPLLTPSDVTAPDADPAKRKIQLPSNGLDDCEWLQPVWTDQEHRGPGDVGAGAGADGKTRYHTFALEHLDRDIGIRDGPFNAVEGFLKLSKKDTQHPN